MPVLAFACASALTPPAAAHAFLDHALPAVGSTVHAPPAQVKLWFTQKLEPAFSNAQVSDSAGKRVDRGGCPGRRRRSHGADGVGAAAGAGPIPGEVARAVGRHARHRGRLQLRCCALGHCATPFCAHGDERPAGIRPRRTLRRDPVAVRRAAAGVRAGGTPRKRCAPRPRRSDAATAAAGRTLVHRDRHRIGRGMARRRRRNHERPSITAGDRAVDARRGRRRHLVRQGVDRALLSRIGAAARLVTAKRDARSARARSVDARRRRVSRRPRVDRARRRRRRTVARWTDRFGRRASAQCRRVAGRAAGIGPRAGQCAIDRRMRHGQPGAFPVWRSCA